MGWGSEAGSQGSGEELSRSLPESPGPFSLLPIPINAICRSTRSTRNQMPSMRDESALTPLQPVDLTPLFPGLHRELMTLLRGLEPSDWIKPTACALWSVKDIVAHLLDTCLRRLSFDRDRLQSGGPRRTFADYADLVGYINQLNAEWVGTMRRV